MQGRHGLWAMSLAACVVVLLLQPGAFRSSDPPGRVRAAGTASPLSAEIRLGYGGYVAPEVWMPAVAVLRSDRDLHGILEVAAPHPRSASAARVQVEVYLSASTPRTVTVPVVLRDLRAPLTVRVLEGDRAVAEWRVTILPTRIVDRVVLALADRPVGMDRLLPPDSRVRVAYVTPDALPARWQLYEGVRAVVIGDLDEGRVTPTQREALSGWVAAGGHLVLAASPGDAVLAGDFLGAFLQGAPRAPALASAPERHFAWGRGAVTVVPVDPFVPELPPEDAAVWTRVLSRGGTGALMDRSLLDALPQTGGASPAVQLLIVLLLGGYLVTLRPLTAWLQRGVPGLGLALTLLAGMAGAAAVLAVVARTQMLTLVQGAVAEGTGQRDLARADVVGRVVLPRGGAFALRADGGTLVRPLAEGDTALRLGGEVALTGRAATTLPLQASALIALPVWGSFRQDGETLAVTIRNRTGRTLRDAVIVHRRRVHSIGAIGAEVSAVLSEDGWRDPPPLEVARGTRARLLAWTLGRLRDGDIIEPTTGTATFLLAWLNDAERGVLRWKERRAPLLVVVPLAGMGESP